MPFLRKYNTLLVTGSTAIRIPIIKRGVVDFAVGADWTPAAGDVKVFVDGAAVANIANLPTAIASGNTAQWEFILTAAELSCKQLLVMVADAATKAVEDQAFIIETYGNASAMYQADLSAANLPVNVVTWNGLTTVALPLVPTVAGRTLDVATTGEAGLDFDNIKGASAPTTLTNITVPTVTAVTNDVGITQAGADKVWASASRTLTAFGFAVTLSAAGVQAIWDALTSALTTVGSIGKLLVDNIDAAISSRLPTASYTTPPTVGAIADQVWDEALAGHLTAGSTGAALNGAGAAGDPWTTTLPGAYGAGTAGFIVGTNLDATVSSRATPAQVATELGIYDGPTHAELVSEINAVQADIAAIPAAPTATENADALLNRDMSAVSDTNARSPLNALRRLRNKNDAAVTPGSIVIYKENDTTQAWVATLTTDAAAVPVVVVDPT